MSPSFPRFPDSGGVITNADVTSFDGYTGYRWSGWLHVDVTGDYRLLATTGAENFWVYLSTDQHSANKTVRVTAEYYHAGNRDWPNAPASAYVTLIAGQRYYFEVLTASYGGPGAAVALQKQGDAPPASGTPGIPGSQLEYLTGGAFESGEVAQVNVTPRSATVYVGRTASFTTGPAGSSSYQWQHDSANLPGETNASLSLTNVQFADAGDYTMVLSNFLGTATATGTLTVVTLPLATAQILSHNPVGYWPFNESTGPTAYDLAGSHDGAGAGGLVFGVAGPASAPFTGFGSGNLAAQFNGTSAEVTIQALNLTTNTVTITGWIKRNGTQAGGVGLFYSRAAGTTSGLHFGDANELRYTWAGSDSTYTWDSGLTPPDGQWTFVALVIEPAQATLYLATNATLYAATNITTHPLQTFVGTTSIGHDPGYPADHFFNGSLDELALFNQALTPSEIGGILAAATGAAPAAATLSALRNGTNLNLSWPAGPGWRLLEQTNNLATGISLNTNDWATVTGSAETNAISIPIDQAKPSKFYRLTYP